MMRSSVVRGRLEVTNQSSDMALSVAPFADPRCGPVDNFGSDSQNLCLLGSFHNNGPTHHEPGIRHLTTGGNAVKFDMGNTALGTLTKSTEGSHQDLGTLVTSLVTAVEPLEGKFNGAGRAAFDQFKGSTDQIAADLNGSLAAILQGQDGMNTAFQTGDIEASDNASAAQGKANFDGARFASRQ